MSSVQKHTAVLTLTGHLARPQRQASNMAVVWVPRFVRNLMSEVRKMPELGVKPRPGRSSTAQ